MHRGFDKVELGKNPQTPVFVRRVAFVCWVPVHPSMPSDPPSPGSPARHALVLDDSTAICGLLKMVMERRGYQVLSFEDPEVALRYLEADSRPVSLALVDVLLPGMNGVEFASRLRALRPDTVLLFSSGRHLDENHADWVRRNGAFFLQKPFTLTRLDALLTEAEARMA